MIAGKDRDGRIARAADGGDGGGQFGVSADAAAWAIRLFCGREPADEGEIEFHRNHPTLDSLRRAFAETWEFRQFFESIGNERPKFGLPLFLLRPPSLPIPWKFEPPTLDEPVSQLCTAAQFQEDAFREIAQALCLHANPHRKTWEHCYIVSVLATFGMIGLGRRALGFGCGRERIPSLLASRGVEVLATDAPEGEKANSQGWRSTQQFASKLSDLFHPQIIHLDDFERLVGFEPVDMNAIPASLDGQFDCCWSSCSLEHLGSLKHGLDFIENSLRTLKPGGIAVHTTEFNLSSNEETVETPGLSIYRRQDIEGLVARLVEQGHEVLPLNLHPGFDPVDEHIDVPPYGLPHLKLMVAKMAVTSVGIVVRKRAA
jgi:SAM-dependent methyltransferase